MAEPSQRSALLSAAWVLPVYAPPIAGGRVRIRGARIEAVGSARDLAASPGEPHYEFPGCVLTPGLINAHTHLELTRYQGKLAPQPFWSWLSGLVRLRADPQAEAQECAGVVDGAWRSLRAGVTTLADISRCHVAWKALRDTPIRRICFAELISIATKAPRTVAELAAALDRVEPSELLTSGVSPHAPYTVSASDLIGAIDLARQRRLPWTMHLAETAEEVAWLAGDANALPPIFQQLHAQAGLTPPGTALADFIRQLGTGHANALLAHLNYVDDHAIAALRESGATAVYCPRTHRFFGHRDHPWRRLRAAGVPVAIATDSLASNPSLSVLEELREILPQAASMSADELLAMVTCVPAAALREAGTLGVLRPGALADLAVFPLPGTPSDPAAALIESAVPAVAVWVNGVAVVPTA